MAPRSTSRPTPAKKPEHVVRLRPAEVDPLRDVDRQLAELQHQLTKLDTREASCTASELHAEGDFIRQAREAIYPKMRALRERRVRLFAGLPEPEPAAPPTPAPDRLARIERDLRVLKKFSYEDLPKTVAEAVKEHVAGALDNVTKAYGDGKAGGGLDDLQVTLGADGRTLSFESKSGGFLRSIRLPIPIDRGAFEEGRTYQPGDEVTFGGGLWRAVKETGARPSGSEDWRLAVRKGRDGKDADPAPLLRLIEEKFAEERRRP